jgi:hypothetical protein
MCCLGIAPLGEVRIDHLPILIDRPVDVGPRSVQANVRFIDPPSVAERSSIRTGSFPKQREKALHPPIDGAAIHDETAFGEPLDHIRITEAIADVPADGQRDHIVGKAMVGKRAGGASGEAPVTCLAAPALSTQPGLPIFACLLTSAPDASHGRLASFL